MKKDNSKTLKCAWSASQLQHILRDGNLVGDRHEDFARQATSCFVGDVSFGKGEKEADMRNALLGFVLLQRRKRLMG